MTITAKQAYEAQSKYANGGYGGKQEYIAAFLADHNTLQAQVVSLWLETLYAWVEQSQQFGWRVDARNEVPYKKAQAIVELLGDRGYQVPFI